MPTDRNSPVLCILLHHGKAEYLGAGHLTQNRWQLGGKENEAKIEAGDSVENGDG